MLIAWILKLSTSPLRSTGVDRGACLILSKINNQLLSFADVESQIFLCAPLFKIGWGWWCHPHTSQWVLLMSESWLNRVNRRGLSTQPWGAPVLSTNIEEVSLPIWTVWGLLLRKSNIQLQSVVLKPRVLRLPISSTRENVSNAELKPQHSVCRCRCYFQGVKHSKLARS